MTPVVEPVGQGDESRPVLRSRFPDGLAVIWREKERDRGERERSSTYPLLHLVEMAGDRLDGGGGGVHARREGGPAAL